MLTSSSLGDIQTKLSRASSSANRTWLALSHHKLNSAINLLGKDYVLAPSPTNDSPNIAHELSRALSNLWPATSGAMATNENHSNLHARVEALEKATADAFHKTLDRVDQIETNSDKLERSAAKAFHHTLDAMEEIKTQSRHTEASTAKALHKTLDRVDEIKTSSNKLEQSAATAFHHTLDSLEEIQKQSRRAEASTAKAFHKTLNRVDQAIKEKTEKATPKKSNNIVLQEIIQEIETNQSEEAAHDVASTGSSEDFVHTHETSLQMDTIKGMGEKLQSLESHFATDLQNRQGRRNQQHILRQFNQNFKQYLDDWENGVAPRNQLNNDKIQTVKTLIDNHYNNVMTNASGYETDATEHDSY